MSIQATREQQRERERSQRERQANAAQNQLSALRQQVTYDPFPMPLSFHSQDQYPGSMPISDPSEDDEQPDDETQLNIQNLFGDFNEYARKMQSTNIPMVNMVPAPAPNHNKRKVEEILSEMNKKHKLHSTQKSLLPDLDSELNATAERYSLKRSNGHSSSSSAQFGHQQQHPQIPPPPAREPPQLQQQPMPPLLQPPPQTQSFNNHSSAGSLNNSSHNANNVYTLNNNNNSHLGHSSSSQDTHKSPALPHPADISIGRSPITNSTRSPMNRSGLLPEPKPIPQPVNIPKPSMSESSSSSSSSSSEDESGSSDSDSSDASDSEIEKRSKKSGPALVAKALPPVKEEEVKVSVPPPPVKNNVWDLDNFIDIEPPKPVARIKNKSSSTPSQDNGFEQDSPPPESFVVSIDISKLNRIPHNLKRTIDGDKLSKSQRHQSSPSSNPLPNNTVKESKHRDKEEKRSKEKSREEKIRKEEKPPKIVDIPDVKSTPPKSSKSSSHSSSSVIANIKREMPKEVRDVPMDIGNVRTPPTVSNSSLNVSKKVSPPEKVYSNSSSSSSAAFRNSSGISSSSSAATILRANIKEKAREEKQSKSRHLSPSSTPKESSKNRDKEEKPRSKDKAGREEKSSKSKIVDLPLLEAKSTPPKKSSSSSHPSIPIKKEIIKEVPIDIGNVRTPPNITSNSLQVPNNSSKKVSPLTKGYPPSSANSSSAFRGNSSTVQAVLRANIKVVELYEKNISDGEAMDRAKKMKRSADAQVDPVKQLAGHLESVMFFVTACLCFERKGMDENSCRLFEETLKYIEQAALSNRNTKNRYTQAIDRQADHKVQAITCRVKAMLSYRVFKYREKQVIEFRETISQINSDPGLKSFVKNQNPSSSTVDSAILIPIRKSLIAHEQLNAHQTAYFKAYEQWSKADAYLMQNQETREFFDALNSKFGFFTIMMPIEEFVNWTLNALKNIYVTSKTTDS